MSQNNESFVMGFNRGLDAAALEVERTAENMKRLVESEEVNGMLLALADLIRSKKKGLE